MQFLTNGPSQIQVYNIKMTEINELAAKCYKSPLGKIRTMLAPCNTHFRGHQPLFSPHHTVAVNNHLLSPLCSPPCVSANSRLLSASRMPVELAS